MPENSSSVTESLKAGNRVVAFGIAAIVLILLAAALFLFLNLPDANAFNARVERLFVENNNLNTGAEIKLLARTIEDCNNLPFTVASDVEAERAAESFTLSSCKIGVQALLRGKPPQFEHPLA